MSQDSPPPPQYHLVYSKSRVTLHPSPYSRDNIAGYLCLLRRPVGGVRPEAEAEGEVSTSTSASIPTSTPSPTPRPRLETLLSWLPETLVSSRSETAKFVDVELREAEGALELGLGERVEMSRRAQADDDHGDHSRDSFQSTHTSTHTAAATRTRTPPTIHTHEVLDEECILIQPPLVGRHAYAFAYALSDIYSLRLVKPSISNWHGSLTVALQGGHALPPLYFHDDESRRTILGMIKAAKGGDDVGSTSYPPPPQQSPPPTWGGDELIQHLRKYTHVHRSVHDHGVFLVDPSPGDLEMHSTPVFADDALDVTIKSRDSSPTFPDDPFAPTYPVHMSGGRTRNVAPAPDSLSAWAKQTRMSLLSSFSQVTRSARQTSRHILSHPAGQPYTSRLPAAVQSFAHAGPLGPFAPVTPDEDPSKISQRAGVAEYDSARVYLAKWARLVAEEGERNKRREEARHPHAPSHERGGLGDFEVLHLEEQADGGRDHSPVVTRNFDPIHSQEWQAWFDHGRPTVSLPEIKRRVWVRGLAPSTRPHAWPYLLGVLDGSVAPDEVWSEKSRQYTALRTLCDEHTSPIYTRPDIVEQRHRIRVDCLRVDRKLPLFSEQTPHNDDDGEGSTSAHAHAHTTRLAEILLAYTIYDSYIGTEITDTPTVLDLLSSPTHISSKHITDSELGGYVQGMSDLCAVLYSIMDGDPTRTLFTFIALMRRVRANFHSNQKGMKTQLVQLQTLLQLVDTPLFTHLESTDSLNLFFCFRWLLVRFKREFPFEDVCRLWECAWALEGTHDHDRTHHLHIFVALYILIAHRRQTIAYLSCFDEVLQYFQGLGGTLDVEDCLRGAERVIRAVCAWTRQQQQREGQSISDKGGDGGGDDHDDDIFRTVRALVGDYRDGDDE